MVEEARKWLELWDGADVDKLSPEIIGGVFAMRRLLEENERLRRDLNNLTEHRWTQTEIDAAKWRAQETAKALEAGGE